MTDQILTKWNVFAAVLFMLFLALAMRLARGERSGVLVADEWRGNLVAGLHVAMGAVHMASECQSCKETREKKGLSPMKKTRLPAGVTDKGFKKPLAPTICCSFCDGDVVASALKTFEARKIK